MRTVQRLERGQPGSLESLNALAAVFEIDLNRLKEPTVEPPQAGPQAATHPGSVPPDEALALAHVRKVKGFYLHLSQYVIVTAALAVHQPGLDRRATGGSSGRRWAGVWASPPTRCRCSTPSRS